MIIRLLAEPDCMLKTQFRSEALIPIGNHSVFSGFSELLCVHPDAEGFFASATNAEIHHVFRDAVQNNGCPKTINIQPAALFDKNFLPTLLRALEDNPTIDRQKFCIEITEHGGVSGFDPRILQFLKDMGIRLALDDFDPRKTEEQIRLSAYAPYIDMIKFPYQLMSVLRDGKSENKQDAIRLIYDLCDRFHDKAVVMEGVRGPELPWAKSELASLGVDYVQIYTPKPPILALAS